MYYLAYNQQTWKENYSIFSDAKIVKLLEHTNTSGVVDQKPAKL